MKTHSASLLLAVMLLPSVGLAQDEAVIQTARKVYKANENAIVTVSATVKITIEGGPAGAAMHLGGGDESRSEASATIIDTAGLAVTSLAELNPALLMPPQKANLGGTTATLKFKGQLSEIKLRLADGTETPARIVLQDDDLDVAFIAPLQPLSTAARANLSAVSLADPGKEPELLDPIIEVGRLNKDMNYQSSLALGRVAAKLVTPRTVYLGASSPGCPAFDGTGKLIGLTLHHRGGEDLAAGPIRAGRSAPVVIPAADLVDLATQAKEEMAKPAKDHEPAKPAAKPDATGK